ncbi:MAG: serine/threonine protein kinase, partial [Proteobacteria bacterium]|nr:serine/threonine protein kinase [Pseudomonadota bacterium]
ISNSGAMPQPNTAISNSGAMPQPNTAISNSDAMPQPNPAISNSDAMPQPNPAPQVEDISKTEIYELQGDVYVPVNSPQDSGEHQADQPNPSAESSAPINHNSSGELNPATSDISITGGSLPAGMKIDDRYEILDVIGEGGFATVYYAHDLAIDREVAIKVMDLKKGVNPSYVQRFFREAKAAAKIHHNNVVAIYDYGHVSATGQPYIAMELLRGHTLSEELSKSGPLNLKRAYKLFRPVVEALSFGHQLGIIHKDLKPENLYLVDPGGPREAMKILDFGVARIQSDATKLTNDGQLLGTPRYLAPEYIQSQTVSPAIDVYQMALIFSEAISGTPAVSGDFYQVMMFHCTGQLLISDYLLSGEVGEVFKHALAVKPEERYPDCEAFGQALDSIAVYFDDDIDCRSTSFSNLKPSASAQSKRSELASGPIPIPAGGQANHQPVQTAPLDNLTSSASDEQSSGKRLWIMIAVGLVIVCLIAIIIAVTMSGSNTNEETQMNGEVEVHPIPTSVQFVFETSPSGASVLRNDIHLICEPTPCKADFNPNDLKLSQLIVFKKDGYADAKYELKESTFGETNGTIFVQLEKTEEEPITLEFYLTYEPANAKVTDAETGEEVCQASPCPYHYEVDRGNVMLLFEAPGYQTKPENIFKRRFDESNGSLKIVMEKQSKAPKAAKTSVSNADPDALCRKAAKAKVMGKVCDSVHLYREAQKAGIKDAVCKRNAEATLDEYSSKCK